MSGASGNGSAMPTTLRALTLNLWGEQPPLDRRLALCVQRIAALRPDVIALQEVRQIPAQVPNTAATLAKALGMGHVFAETIEWGGGHEGLAILSRWPIAGHGHTELPHATREERRILLWAELDVPGGAPSSTGIGPGKVAVFCTHLNYRMSHGLEREAQVASIDQQIRSVTAQLAESAQRAAQLTGQPNGAAGLPAPLVTLLMGDFNATPDSDEMRFLRGLHTLAGRRTYYQDAFMVRSDVSPALDPGYTWSRRNPYTQKLRFLQADRRLDYIYVGQPSRDGRGTVHDCRVVLDAPDADGVYPSDHFGVLAEIQLVPLV